jgi:hypothetical protein
VEAVNQPASAAVLALNASNPAVMSILQAFLMAVRLGQVSVRPAGPAAAAPANRVGAAAPVPMQPPAAAAFWGDLAAEEFVPAAVGEELAAAWLTDKSPGALSALLGLGILGASLCRPWWSEEDEKRPSDEKQPRRLFHV